MGTQHKFIGVNESGSRIAGVEVIACETDVSDVALGASVPEGWARREYGAAVLDGVRSALDWRQQRGGRPHSIEVTQILDFPADSTADAMRCAAATATWIALGGVKEDLERVFTDGQWTVRLK